MIIALSSILLCLFLSFLVLFFQKIKQKELLLKDLGFAHLQIQERENLLAARDDELKSLRLEAKDLCNELATVKNALEEEKKFNIERVKFLEDAKISLKESFQSLSQEALKASSQNFLQLAETRFEKLQETAKGSLQLKEQAFIELVKPIKESLKEVDGAVKEMEKSRISAYASLSEQVKNLLQAQIKLESETSSLASSLKVSTSKGMWGEIQLKRVVEMAGMLEYCDFIQQETQSNNEGKLRPDMIIKLPNDKIVIIDSKAPLQAFLEAGEAEESLKHDLLKIHAKKVRSHIMQLSSKGYWGQFQNTPEFVVLFLPGEVFFSAALKADPGLIEYAIQEKVILASPTTLIALLKAIAYGWSQEKIAKNAEDIAILGGEMLQRLNTMLNHFDAIRKGLETSVEAYNKTVGSLEMRLLPQARRFHEMAPVKVSDLTEIKAIDKFPREIVMRPENQPEDYCLQT